MGTHTDFFFCCELNATANSLVYAEAESDKEAECHMSAHLDVYAQVVKSISGKYPALELQALCLNIARQPA